MLFRDDIVGLDEVKKQLNRCFILPQKFPEWFSANKIEETQVRSIKITNI